MTTIRYTAARTRRAGAIRTRWGEVEPGGLLEVPEEVAARLTQPLPTGRFVNRDPDQFTKSELEAEAKRLGCPCGGNKREIAIELDARFPVRELASDWSQIGDDEKAADAEAADEDQPEAESGTDPEAGEIEGEEGLNGG